MTMTSSPSSENVLDSLRKLYVDWSGEAPSSIVPIGADGSSRRYVRMAGTQGTAIGAYNADRKENVAFLTFSHHFRRYGLPVPEIYAEHLDAGLYLQQDLGDDTLFTTMTGIRREHGFSGAVVAMYREVVDWLPRFQIVAGRDVDYSVCYPRSRFDAQSMRWDLNYFKYDFLKLAGIPFEEQALEDDFDRLIAFLEQADCAHFLYRDFQSRNIMWTANGPFFIDYQGGRQGALQYDIASLMLDARANIPWDIRETLIAHYMEAVSGYLPVAHDTFLQHYNGYAYLRLMQALGAYGFRGLHEGKTRFLSSIPPAINNLETLIARRPLPLALPQLSAIFDALIASAALRQYGSSPGPGLTVHIRSFSYRKGLPRDESGHGGGFVFDCRMLPNPGRQPEYAALTGRDAAVAAFLERHEAVHRFFEQCREMVDQAIAHHQGRGFTDLSVAFGCTGGQHRSVYCAERLAAYLTHCEGVRVDLNHRELQGV